MRHAFPTSLCAIAWDLKSRMRDNPMNTSSRKSMSTCPFVHAKSLREGNLAAWLGYYRRERQTFRSEKPEKKKTLIKLISKNVITLNDFSNSADKQTQTQWRVIRDNTCWVSLLQRVRDLSFREKTWKTRGKSACSFGIRADALTCTWHLCVTRVREECDSVLPISGRDNGNNAPTHRERQPMLSCYELARAYLRRAFNPSWHGEPSSSLISPRASSSGNATHGLANPFALSRMHPPRNYVNR